MWKRKNKNAPFKLISIRNFNPLWVGYGVSFSALEEFYSYFFLIGRRNVDYDERGIPGIPLSIVCIFSVVNQHL